MRYGYSKKSDFVSSLVSAKAILCAVAVGGAAAGWQHKQERESEYDIPTNFSGVDPQTGLTPEGVRLPPLGRFYAVAHDLPMHVFAARNAAGKKGAETAEFAKDLVRRLTPYLPVGTQAAAAQEVLRPAMNLANEMRVLSGQVATVWEVRHEDHYRTETHTGTDANGKLTTETESVYDHTTHTYSYRAAAGRALHDSLVSFHERFPGYAIPSYVECDRAPSQAEITYVEQSARPDPIGGDPTILKTAQPWACEASIAGYQDHVFQAREALYVASKEWAAAWKTAHRVSYDTEDRDDAGPKEFRVAQAVRYAAQKASGQTSIIFNDISNYSKAERKLHSAAWDFIRSAAKGDSSASRYEEKMIDAAKDIYQANFRQGVDVDPFSWGMVVLIGAGGLATGLLAGAGIDAALRRRKKNQQGSRPGL